MNYIKASIRFIPGSIILLSFFHKFVISFHKVTEQNSMSPSINPSINEKNWISKYDYILCLKFLKPNEKRIIYMYHPYEDIKVVRYLSGLPGDWIQEKNSNVFHKVPEGHMWVDCLNGDDDSNSWGPVPIPLIIGHPVLIIRPFRKTIPEYKISMNLSKKLNISQRVLDDHKIGEFFI